MKKITCEICGSNDVIKKDNFFECQTCGTKYSTEEVKKIILEGSIDISGSTVKIDNSGNIENYLSIAKNAYNANNISECENYCNMILEIDSKNYEALLLKGKLECRYARIEGIKSYFFNALENVPEDKIDEVKEEILTEILYVCEYLMNNVCEEAQEHIHTDHLCMEVIDYINEKVEELKENFMKLFLRCEVEEKDINGSLFLVIFKYATEQFKKEHEEYTSHYGFHKRLMFYRDNEIKLKIQWDNFISVGDTYIYVIEDTIRTVRDSLDAKSVCQCYQVLIDTQEILLNTRYSYTDMYTDISVESGFSEEERLARKNKIMEWHRKWNELDHTHIIPTNELEKNEEKRNITNKGKEITHNYSNTSNNSKRTTYNYSNTYNDSSNGCIKAIIYLILACVIFYFLFHSDDMKNQNSLTEMYQNTMVVDDDIYDIQYDTTYTPGRSDPFSYYE